MIAAVGLSISVRMRQTNRFPNQWLTSSSRRPSPFSPILRRITHTTHRGVGLGVGVVASVIFFRRSSPFPLLPPRFWSHLFIGRTWPVALSTGFGAGAAYADCDRSFNPARIPGTRIISPEEVKASFDSTTTSK